MAVVTEVKTKETTNQEQLSDALMLDFGKKSKKSIKQLRKGRGKLLAKVKAAIEEFKADGTISASAQPVIVVIRQKEKSGFFL